MKKMLFIVGMFLFSLGVSNVYGQSSSFVPIIVNIHVASGAGNVEKPKVSFYKMSNPTVVSDIYTWIDGLKMFEGSSSGDWYASVKEAGTYTIVFTGGSPLHTVSISNVKLDIDKGCYRLSVYVEPTIANSRITISGPN